MELQQPPASLEATAWLGFATATALALVPVVPTVFVALRNLWEGAVVWRLPGELASGLVVASGALLAASGAVAGTMLIG